MVRAVVVSLALLLLFQIVRADEDPDTRKQRLANVAQFERKGKAPWSVTFSITDDDHRESKATAGHNPHTAKSSRHGTGGGRMVFFVEDDATQHQFSIDGNGALWKSNTGTGSSAESTESTTFESNCNSYARSNVERSTPSMVCLPFFEIDDDQKIWRFGVGCDGTADVKSDDVDHPDFKCAKRERHDKTKDQGHIGGECTNDSPGAKLSRDKNGFTIDCTIKASHASDSNSDETVSGSSTVVIHGRIDYKLAVGYFATIEPQDEDVYAKWSPEGPPLDGKPVKGKDGNKLGLKLVLRDATTLRPVGDKKYDASIAIASSKVPGVAMNYPAAKEADTEADLRFVQDDNTGKVKGKDDELLSFANVTGETKFSVTSRDYGGYAAVSAVVIVDGKQVDVRAAAGGRETPTLSIPRDVNSNHVSDGWEDEKGITRSSYGPTWDEEDKPTMYTQGDGFSLYDEYRGFYLRPGNEGTPGPKSPAKHLRLEPTKRELIVAVEDDGSHGTLGYSGALTYGKATSTSTPIVVHFLPEAKYAGKFDGADDKGRPRMINFNRPKTEKLDDPTALVWVWFDPDPNKPAKGATADTDQTIPGAIVYQSPAFTHGVHVFTKNCEAEVAAEIWYANQPSHAPYDPAKYERMQASLKAHGITPAAFEKKVRKRMNDAVLDLIEFTVIHELGHATGAQHHEVAPYSRCRHGCKFDNQCDGCDPFTKTSKRSPGCTLGEDSNGNELPAWKSEPRLKDDSFTSQYGWNCYPGEPEHFGGGDENCPMRYWHYMDGGAVVKFGLGEWLVSKAGPSSAWHFCKENLPTMRLRQSAAQALLPALK